MRWRVTDAKGLFVLPPFTEHMSGSLITWPGVTRDRMRFGRPCVSQTINGLVDDLLLFDGHDLHAIGDSAEFETILVYVSFWIPITLHIWVPVLHFSPKSGYGIHLAHRRALQCEQRRRANRMQVPVLYSQLA
jgi:hypothetical protein